MWTVNQRIIKVLVELMRNHDTPESLVVLASASVMLLQATEGMLVDGEACNLPHLELLEVTARAVQPLLDWGESGVADGFSNLLKCRLPDMVRCTPSAHVRALSTSVLRAILHAGSIKSDNKQANNNGERSSQHHYISAADWQANIEKCLTWEAHSRIATGLSTEFVVMAAKELGCNISM